MRPINTLVFTALPSVNGPVSFLSNRGDIADRIEALLAMVLGVGEDGRLMDDAKDILRRSPYWAEIKWALRLCTDTRNAHEVAGELAWAGASLIGHVDTYLYRNFCKNVCS